MIGIYWSLISLLGFVGVLNGYQFYPAWILLEALGFMLIMSKIIWFRGKISSYVTPLGLCFFAWFMYANIFYVFSYYTPLDLGYKFSKETINLGFFLSFISVCVFGICYELSMRIPHTKFVHLIPDTALLAKRQPFPPSILLLVSLMVVLYMANIAMSGAFALLGKADRAALSNAMETGKTWLMNYMITGATLYYVYALGVTNLDKVRYKYYYGSLLIIFWLTYLSLGNRRGLITVFVSIALMLAFNGKLKSRHIWVGIISFLFLAGVGTIRQVGQSSFGDIEVAYHLLNSVGEFYFPQITLLQSIESSKDLLLGSTFVTWFPDFFLSKVNNDEFLFLAQRFALDFTPSTSENIMGFAYLPLTEGYNNFGVTGAVVAPVAVAGIIRFMEEVFGAKSFSVFVLGALAVDINRADFGGISLQYLFIVFTGFLLLFIAAMGPLYKSVKSGQ